MPRALYRFVFYAFCLLATGWSACDISGNNRPDKEIRAFQTRLDSLKAATPDSLQPTVLSYLYGQISGELRPFILNPFLKETARLLFYQLHADTILIPFYRGLINDPQLPDTARANAALQMAAYYAYVSVDPDSAAYYGEIFRKNADSTNDVAIAKGHAITAQMAQLRGDLPQATAALYKAIQHSEKAHDTPQLARNYGNRAIIYRQLEDYDRAIADQLRARNYFKSVRDSASWLTAAGGLAASYNDVRQADSARYYFGEAEKLLTAGVKQPVAEYYLYLTQGGFHINRKQYDSAVFYFQKAAPFAEAFGDENTEMMFLNAATRAYAQRRRVPVEAQRIADYIPTWLADSDLANARDAYYTLYMVALTEKNADAALNYYQLYDSVRTELSNDHNRAHIANLEAQYEGEKKALTIQLQEKQLRQRRTLNIIFGLSVLAFVLAFAIIVNRSRLSRSRREAVLQKHFTTEMLKHTEAERGRIAIDLHDGISHELLNLKNNLTRTTAESEARIDDILNDIRMLSRNLHPVMLDKIGLEHSVQHLCEQIMEGGRLFVSADIDYQNQLSPEGELQLYRIIQESLSNVVKYADAVAAKVRIYPEGQCLMVSVIDNGKGFDVSGKLTSKSAFGLHSILARSEALGGKATFISGAEGTTITVEIPLS